MEGLFFILVGSALFAHSWYLLGLYTDGRMMGIVMAALAAGMLITLTLDPQLLGTAGPAAGKAAQVTILETLIVAWAIYAGVVAAHGIWDFEDRAIGFFTVPLTAVSAVAVAYYASIAQRHYDDIIWLSLTVVAVLLTLLAGVLFFYLAIPFRVLRVVTAGALLGLSPIIAAIGMAIITTAIS